ncbi:MAG: hypothetical protein NTZ83_05140 [Candidatus Pacearchaeota archaeon]|nr:hypothetical protein [Candidatus Pacearchaeota archaeon]
MDGINLAKEIVYEVNRKVKRVYWTNEEIDKFFGKRSAKEIIDNKTTCFMNPCLDLTLVSAYLMSSHNIKHDFVIEEHPPTKDFNFNKSYLVLKDFNYRLHFALEFQHEGEEYSLDYKRENEVYIFKGKYNGREDIPRAGMIIIPGENINPYKPIYKNLGYNTLEELIKDKFKGYSLESNLNRLKQDNSEENFRSYQKRYGDEFNINPKPQNPLSL